MSCRLRKIYVLCPVLLLCLLYFHIALLGLNGSRKVHVISASGQQNQNRVHKEEKDFADFPSMKTTFADFQNAKLQQSKDIAYELSTLAEDAQADYKTLWSAEVKPTTKITEMVVSTSTGVTRKEDTDIYRTKFKRKCPIIPPNLLGKMKVDVKSNATLKDIEKELREKPEAGRWFPKWCFARDRVAIVIPFRDRHAHLTILLKYLIPMLQRQLLDFRIFVPEQLGNGTFNKGRLMNAAVKEAMSEYDFRCVIFHDVDLVPEDDRNMYSCQNQPFHLSISIDQWKYIYMYDKLVGGALNLRKDHLLCVNGYSNGYWGWGAEDDDMAERIQACKLKIVRPPGILGRYKSIPHIKRGATKDQDKNNGKLLHHAVKHYKSVKERMKDGLTNVPYKLVKKTKLPLFTYLLIDVGNSTL